MKECANCGLPVDPDETYEDAGQIPLRGLLPRSKDKAGNLRPRAVYSAKRSIGSAPQLTEVQFRILNLIKNRRPS